MAKVYMLCTVNVVFMVFFGVVVLWAGYGLICKGQVGAFADRLDAGSGSSDDGAGGAS